ncbi:MAG: hypothetical protein COB26_00530 [Piscirickettsiaceae bacterium]|nr:MAG: hypothetical protein COB26_06795 [Piscirickettsiaceae bacterium]PCI72212.1 MAG: hypothetical protein COB26_00530 [Piscirickettsiaceae bacterium]
MTQLFSRLIALGCMAILITVPFIALYFLINIDLFATMTRSHLGLPIQWQTVSEIQWYSLWLLTVFYIAIGLAGLYFLRRAFSNFAKGQLFNHSNSRDLRLFSILLFAQALAKPLYFSISSVLLSMNHPSGQKMLSVSFGSDEVKVIALAMILWVMSDLLVRGCKLESENKQFI